MRRMMNIHTKMISSSGNKFQKTCMKVSLERL